MFVHVPKLANHLGLNLTNVCACMETSIIYIAKKITKYLMILEALNPWSGKQTKKRSRGFH
jgi:hypothetical protein